MSLKTIINNETKKSFFSRLRNKITPYLLSLGILAGAYFSDLPKSFAQEKTKTEKENKRFKLPDWLNLYADAGYVYGERYILSSDVLWRGSTTESDKIYWNLNSKGKNIYDISIGAGILFRYKNIPIFLNVNSSNMCNGFGKRYTIYEYYFNREEGIRRNILKWDASYPFISYSIGSFKKFANKIIGTAFSYSRNIKGIESGSTFNNYAFSAYLSKSYRNFIVDVSTGFLKKNSEHIRQVKDKWGFSHGSTNGFNENTIPIEIIVSYNLKHFKPYISFHNEIYKKSSIDRHTIYWYPILFINDSKNGIIIKSGIHFSNSNVLGWFKNVSGFNFHQSNIIEYTQW